MRRAYNLTQAQCTPSHNIPLPEGKNVVKKHENVIFLIKVSAQIVRQNVELSRYITYFEIKLL